MKKAEILSYDIIQDSVHLHIGQHTQDILKINGVLKEINSPQLQSSSKHPYTFSKTYYKPDSSFFVSLFTKLTNSLKY